MFLKEHISPISLGLWSSGYVGNAFFSCTAYDIASTGIARAFRETAEIPGSNLKASFQFSFIEGIRAGPFRSSPSPFKYFHLPHISSELSTLFPAALLYPS